MLRYATWNHCPDCDGKGSTVPHGPICRRCYGSGWDHQ